MCKVNTLNLSNFHISPFRSPPLPDTAPPPSWGGPGAAGTRQILKQTSRQSIQSNESAGPLYANIGSSDHQDGRHMSNRSNTLPSHRSSDGDSYDNVSSSSKEKKSSVLGRFLGRRNK